ncbi:MAG: NADH-quinone oxidoreductase subunit N [Polyangiaceae bacterium]|nr:NADH-quinone oxidoreductase subunit N [Polyangiaceae bacterium]
MNVSLADLLPLSLDLALCAGILLTFLADLFSGPKPNRAIGVISVATFAGALIASFQMDLAGSAFGGAYVGDHWTLFFKRAFLVAGLLTSLGSMDHVARRQPHRQGEYYLLLMCSVLGMTLLPGARDLVLLIVAFELMGLPLFVLAAFAKTEDPKGVGKDGPEAALKLYLVGAVSAAITLFGMSFVYGMTGATRIEAIAQAPVTPLFVLGVMLVLAGMAFKIGVVPFHMWVPDTYQGAPTPFVAFLSVAPKLAGFAALATLFHHGFDQVRSEWQPLLVGLSLVSMVLGNLLAVVQTNVKRMLAYSGIGHIGYMLMAFVSGSGGTTMLLFYFVAYLVTNIGAFQVVEAVERETGDASLGAFAGMWKRSPLLAFAMLIFLLSLAGIPFVVGFWAKLYVFIVAWHSGLYLLVILGAVLAVVGLFYYMQIARSMYMAAPAREGTFRAPPTLLVSVLFCLAAVVAIGAWPSPVLEDAGKATQPFVSARTATLK